MDAVSLEAIGAVFLIIGTNFIFARWNYYVLSEKIKVSDEKAKERDLALDRRIDTVKEDRQKCKEEHAAQSAEMFSQLYALVKSSHESFCLLMEKVSTIATDTAITKDRINIATVIGNKIDDQTEAITKAIKSKKGD